MSQRNKNNSIVFLTTLSVYLGLVMVGGAMSPVLAQAATARNFNVQDEIEVKDDLDKKPDNEESLLKYAEAVQELFSQTKNFSEEKSKWLPDGKYEFDCSLEYVSDDSYNAECIGLFAARFGFPLDKVAHAFPHTFDKKKEQVTANLILDKENFFLKATFNQDLTELAEQFQTIYGSELSKIKIQRFSIPENVVLQNTEISYKNNQVFIVTRLPRGSLDALIKQDAKVSSK